MKMNREKAALGVFAFLTLAGLAVLLSYIFVWGHQLNVAASTIDDAAGSLDGYTVLICEGTAERRSETVVGADDPVDALASRTLNRASTRSGAEGGDGELDASDAAAKGDGASRRATVFGLQRSYVLKGADAVVLDVAHPQAYNERTLVRTGSHLIGILSIDEVTANERYLSKRVAAYRALGVDVVVALTSDVGLLKGYDGVDVVVSTRDEGLPSHGARAAGAFYDDVPLRGQVGTVLISPSRTITAKDVAAM